MGINSLQSRAAILTRILSPRELGEITGLSPATIWRMRARRDLPEPIRLSPGRVGWREDVISEWLENRGPRDPQHNDPTPRRRKTDR